jgi:hypothetical protein
MMTQQIVNDMSRASLNRNLNPIAATKILVLHRVANVCNYLYVESDIQSVLFEGVGRMERKLVDSDHVLL